MNSLPEMVRPPAQFQRYPTPGGPLHGIVQIDLGEWFVNGNNENFCLRITGEDLLKVVAAVMDNEWNQKNYGALSVFKVAGTAGTEAT